MRSGLFITRRSFDPAEGGFPREACTASSEERRVLLNPPETLGGPTLPRWRTLIFFSRVRPSPNPPHRRCANNEDKVLRETVLGACEKGCMRGWPHAHNAARVGIATRGCASSRCTCKRVRRYAARAPCIPQHARATVLPETRAKGASVYRAVQGVLIRMARMRR